MIHLIAIITAKTGRRADLLVAINANRPAVLAEPGCVEYCPLTDDPNSAIPLGPDVVLIVERWADGAALDEHRLAPHMLAYRERTQDLVHSRTIHLLRQA